VFCFLVSETLESMNLNNLLNSINININGHLQMAIDNDEEPVNTAPPQLSPAEIVALMRQNVARMASGYVHSIQFNANNHTNIIFLRCM
jgi:hypothetical protein